MDPLDLLLQLSHSLLLHQIFRLEPLIYFLVLIGHQPAYVPQLRLDIPFLHLKGHSPFTHLPDLLPGPLYGLLHSLLVQLHLLYGLFKVHQHFLLCLQVGQDAPLHLVERLSGVVHYKLCLSHNPALVVIYVLDAFYVVVSRVLLDL